MQESEARNRSTTVGEATGAEGRDRGAEGRDRGCGQRQGG